MSEIAATTVHEAYAFACMKCGYGWEQSYEIEHHVDVHGHADGDELQAALRASLVPDVPPITLGEGAFVQVIEFSTSRMPEFQELEDRWRDEIGDDRTARWAITAADRGAADRYLQIVGFPDYEAAMANSKHPVTGRFAEQLRGVCEGEATFRDLDVRRVQAF